MYRPYEPADPLVNLTQVVVDGQGGERKEGERGERGRPPQGVSKPPPYRPDRHRRNCHILGKGLVFRLHHPPPCVPSAGWRSSLASSYSSSWWSGQERTPCGSRSGRSVPLSWRSSASSMASPRRSTLSDGAARSRARECRSSGCWQRAPPARR